MSTILSISASSIQITATLNSLVSQCKMFIFNYVSMFFSVWESEYMTVGIYGGQRIPDPLELSYWQSWVVKCGCWDVKLDPLPLIHLSVPKTTVYNIQISPCLCHCWSSNSSSGSVLTIQCYLFQNDFSDFQGRLDRPPSWSRSVFLLWHVYYFVTGDVA